MKLLPVILFFLVFNLNAQNTLPNCNSLYLCDDELIKFARDFLAFPPSDCKLWDGSCSYDGEISRTGKVTIGSPNWMYSDYKLGVRGGIVTEQLKICNEVWCDYVFEDSFNLMPLVDVAYFIRKNGHLPNSVPAAAIENGEGIEVERETVSQQKNIEEIYLHLFDLDQRLNLLGKSLPEIKEEKPATATRETQSYNKSALLFLTKVLSEDILLDFARFQIRPATIGMSNGKAGVIVSGAVGAISVTCTNLSTSATQTVNNSSCTETIVFSNLPEGLYRITVTDAGGNTKFHNLTIEGKAEWAADKCAILGNLNCQLDIVNMLQEGVKSGNCDQWDGGNCSLTSGLNKIFRPGNVCIGTDQSQGGFSLAVKGGIVTDEFRIELCETEGWCDYVFDEAYNFMPLKEVGEFTRSNKHLPGMLTQAQILEEGGYEVKTVKTEQQVKIEEAFLYLIQLEGKKQQIQKQLSEL